MERKRPQKIKNKQILKVLVLLRLKKIYYIYNNNDKHLKQTKPELEKDKCIRSADQILLQQGEEFLLHFSGQRISDLGIPMVYRTSAA